jgi:hypothetical protein
MIPEVTSVIYNGQARFYCAAAFCSIVLHTDEKIFCGSHDSQLPEPPLKNGFTAAQWRKLITDQRRKEHVHGWQWNGTTAVTTTAPPSYTTTDTIDVAKMPQHTATDGLGNVSVMGCLPPTPPRDPFTGEQKDGTLKYGDANWRQGGSLTEFVAALKNVRRENRIKMWADEAQSALATAQAALVHIRAELADAEGR